MRIARQPPLRERPALVRHEPRYASNGEAAIISRRLRVMPSGLLWELAFLVRGAVNVRATPTSPDGGSTWVIEVANGHFHDSTLDPDSIDAADHTLAWGSGVELQSGWTETLWIAPLYVEPHSLVCTWPQRNLRLEVALHDHELRSAVDRTGDVEAIHIVSGRSRARLAERHRLTNVGVDACLEPVVFTREVPGAVNRSETILGTAAVTVSLVDFETYSTGSVVNLFARGRDGTGSLKAVTLAHDDAAESGDFTLEFCTIAGRGTDDRIVRVRRGSDAWNDIAYFVPAVFERLTLLISAGDETASVELDVNHGPASSRSERLW